MPASAHEITRDDILPMDAYGAQRKERRQQVTEMKKHRRIHVGPDATFYFENFETMWHQVHEMLFIEKGGEEQIADELGAFNPLIPSGSELIATLMFEIDDERRRTAFLSELGGVEESVTIEFDGEVVKGEPEEDVDRTTADGKASSVQFIHFPFTVAQKVKFATPGTQVTLAIGHTKYGHMTRLAEDVRAALAGDFD